MQNVSHNLNETIWHQKRGLSTPLGPQTTGPVLSLRLSPDTRFFCRYETDKMALETLVARSVLTALLLMIGTMLLWPWMQASVSDSTSVYLAVPSRGSSASLPVHLGAQSGSGPVPFYMYDDPDITMAEVLSCPGFGASETADVEFIKLMQQHPWRVQDPEQARVHIIPTPLAASFTFGNKTCGGTHMGRVFRAFRRLLAHPVYRRHTLTHYLHCHYWQCFLGWGWPNERLFPDALFQEGNMANIMMGRYERHYSTLSDCELYGATFEICKHSHQLFHLENTGLYHMRWELSRCAIVVPYLASRSLRVLRPSFEEWQQRNNTVFYHIKEGRFVWGATDIRRAPINGSFSKLPGVEVGFTIPHKEWVSKLEQSKFCLVSRGDTPSSHALYNAIKVGCVPVIVSDTFSLFGQPFSTQLPWSLFTITISEQTFLSDPLAVARVLWQMHVNQLRALVLNVQRIAQPALLYEPNGTLGAHVLRQLVEDCLN